MTKNMGPADKAIRIFIAVIIAVLYFTNVISATWALVLGIVAGIFIITSLAGFCPLYRLFNINTCQRK